ncbi:MAG TPA: hypothetical protein VF292_15550 [Rhodanobacteraceae bacterium]
MSSRVGTLVFRGAAAAAAVVAMGSLAACAPQPVMPGPVDQPVPGFKLVEPLSPAHDNLQRGESVLQPQPKRGHFAPPLYPAALESPTAAPVTVLARMTFGADGRVQRVNFVPDSYAGPGHALYDGAVRSAAQSWAFTPLEFRTVTGYPDGLRDVQRDVRPFSLWFAFRFAMVNGMPDVQTVSH